MDQSNLVPIMTIWREASGEGPAGLAAVAWVIRNRMAKYGVDAEAVCLKRWAFSSMSAPSDPGLLRWPAAGDASFAQAITTWQAPGADPTEGATLYYATYIAPPVWAHSPKTHFTVQIGKQRFYRED